MRCQRFERRRLRRGTITPGVTPTAQYQFGRQRFNDQTFTGFGAVLPFTLPVAKNFQYASATQANLTLERELNKNTAISIGYIYVGAHHLPHPTDLNTPQTNLQIQNFQRFFGGALPTSSRPRWRSRSPVQRPARQPASAASSLFREWCHLPGGTRRCPGGCQLLPPERTELLPGTGAFRRRGDQGRA